MSGEATDTLGLLMVGEAPNLEATTGSTLAGNESSTASALVNDWNAVPALEPILTDALWAELEALIPPPPPDNHPWGPKGHRQRVSDRLVFERLLLMLQTSHSSFGTFAVQGVVSASTLRRRFREWTDAGVFERLRDTALSAYDKMVGLDLDHLAVDGFKTTAPRGGDASGPNPTDRRKMGRNWLNLVEKRGVPLVLIPASANTNDHFILEDALDTFEASALFDAPVHPMLHAGVRNELVTTDR